jgi:hypothetical protein
MNKAVVAVVAVVLAYILLNRRQSGFCGACAAS